MRKFLALAAVFFSAAAFSAEKVDVQDLQVVTANGITSVQGIAHNNTNAVLHNLFVNFKLYDGQGNVVGNTIAHAQEVEPGENFKFSAPAAVPFKEARLSKVDAY